MNLAKLFEAQKKFDDAVAEAKGLQGKDLLPEKILALQVEIGELANEWRGFKFWSDDQEPRTKVQGYSGSGALLKGEVSNPLLEEYADCLHFILSIGLDIKADKLDYLKVMKAHEAFGITYVEANLTKQFGLVYYFVSGFEDMYGSDEYTEVLLSILRLGEMLDFTWEQIEQAYYAKNKVNYKRLASGY